MVKVKHYLFLAISIAIIGNMKAAPPNNFEEVAVKEKIWGALASFKQANKVQGMKLSSKRQKEWNTFVKQADDAISEFQKFDRENDNILSKANENEKKIERLTKEQHPLYVQAETKIKDTTAYQTLTKKIENLSNKEKAINQKIKSIEKRIEPTKTLMKPLRDQRWKIKEELEVIIRNDPEYKREYEEINKKHGGPMGIARVWMDSMNALEKKIRDKHAQTEKFKNFNKQLAEINDKLAILKAKIKSETDEIDKHYEQQYKLFQQKRKIQKEREKLVKKEAIKNSRYVEIDKELEEAKKKINAASEKIFEAMPIIVKHEEAQRGLQRIFHQKEEASGFGGPRRRKPRERIDMQPKKRRRQKRLR